MDESSVPLPLACAYRATLVARESVWLPRFVGPTLRGSLGLALRDVACEQPAERSCERCTRPETCIYARLFETSVTAGSGAPWITTHAPHPFAIAPLTPIRPGERGGKRLDAGRAVEVRFTLIGEALDWMPHMVAALELAAERGLGRLDPRAGRFERGRFVLDNIRTEDRVNECAGTAGAPVPGELDPLWSRQSRILGAWKPAGRPINAADREVREVQLTFLTPLRVKSGGKIRSQPSFEEIVEGLARRIRALSRFGKDALDQLDWQAAVEASARVRTEETDFHSVQVKRYSNRQHRRMLLPGVVGHMRVTGDLAPILPLLRYGEIVQTGKSTSMGFGLYRATVA